MGTACRRCDEWKVEAESGGHATRCQGFITMQVVEPWA